MKGKQGRFRGNLSGKRVEYTDRTVISPDPNLKIMEVAIPILMAWILTYPYQKAIWYHDLRIVGKVLCFLIRGGKVDRSLSINARKHLAYELKFGDAVDRHLIDGDVVLFNRQPSLHHMSIMSHRERIMPRCTLRFNESICNPYNVDFDGDEMNMHVTQIEEARIEDLILMGVGFNVKFKAPGSFFMSAALREICKLIA
ncbi:DNA-directed RNA polymerase III subunit 1 [Tanacetum coccineum]